MKKILFPVIFCFLLLSSCYYSSEDENPSLDYSSAIQLKVGSYWVYNFKAFNINTGETIEYYDDSTFISNDTIIEDKIYSIFKNEYGLLQFRRDSSGYSINEKNEIGFSARNFSDTLYKNPPEYGIMHEKEEEVEVPAGKFTTIPYMLIIKDMHHHHDHQINDPTMLENSMDFRLVSKSWYAKDIGLVKSVLYFNGTAYERQLKKYSIK